MKSFLFQLSKDDCQNQTVTVKYCMSHQGPIFATFFSKAILLDCKCKVFILIIHYRTAPKTVLYETDIKSGHHGPSLVYKCNVMHYVYATRFTISHKTKRLHYCTSIISMSNSCMLQIKLKNIKEELTTKAETIWNIQDLFSQNTLLSFGTTVSKCTLKM